MILRAPGRRAQPGAHITAANPGTAFVFGRGYDGAANARGGPHEKADVAAGPCTTSSDAGDNCATGNDPRFVGVFTYNGPGSEPENHSFYVALIG